MTWWVIIITGGVLLSGVSALTGAEWHQEVRAARLWLAKLPARVVAGASAGRKPPRVENAAAAGGAPGAARARLSAAAPGTAPLAQRASFSCCVHCDVPTACEVPDAHASPCFGGCNQEAPRHAAAEPRAAAAAGPPACEYETAGVTAWGPPIDVYALFADRLAAEGITDLCAAEGIKLPRPPWESAPIPAVVHPTMIPVRRTRTEPVAVPAIAGARGGCTGTTHPQRALGLADLGPADPRPLTERIHAS